MLPDLLGFDPRQVLDQVVELVYSPASNLTASLLLLSFVVILAAIVAVIIVMVILGHRRNLGDEGSAVFAAAPGSEEEPESSAKGSRILGLLFIGGLCALAWVSSGVSTSPSYMCTPCHGATPHAALKADAAHADVPCTRCHEPGGVVYSATLALPSRMVHLVQGVQGGVPTSEYGYVDSSACRACHGEVLVETTESERRGIRVSHKEPTDAGARCVDCHRPNKDGVVSGSFGGMDPCLRCHDGKSASNECALCHTGDIGYAAVADHRPSPLTASALVTAPYDCYTCHDAEPCDSCHGLRLPHEEKFVEGGHRYEGARSVWAGSSGSCARCHTDERNSCKAAGCHSPEFPYHYQQDRTFPRTHASGRWIREGGVYFRPSNLSCNTCHKMDCESCHELRPTIPSVLEERRERELKRREEQ